MDDTIHINQPNVKQLINYFLILSLGLWSISHSTTVSAKSKGSGVHQYTGKAFVYNPRTLTWSAISNGKVIRTGRGSGGRGYCPDIHRSCRTPVGTFHVKSKGGPGCRSSRYPVGRGGAPMPYCMFFTRLYAVHGSYDVPNHNASHGCIRVIPSDANWLSHNFMSIGTTVVVKSY